MNRSIAVLAVCALPCWSAAQQQQPVAEPPVAARTAKEAIDAGIAWLLAHQEESGGWSASQFQRHDPKGDLCTGTGKPDQDLHVTALATFAMLSRGDTEREGQRQPMQRAQAWLQAQQQKDGFFGAPEGGNAVEAHALVCLAMAEGKERGQPMPAQALARLAALRLPDGTWPARPGEAKGDPMATYWAGLATFLESLANLDGSRVDLETTLAAMAEGRLATASLPSAEAMLRLMAQHNPKRDARLAELVAKIAEEPPKWCAGVDAARMDFLAWQLGTHAMNQTGGAEWEQWYPALLVALVPHQRTDGAHAGSWDPVDARGQQGGRIYATAVNVMSLASCHRFGRVVDREAPAKKK